MFSFEVGDTINYEVTNEKVKSAVARGKADFGYQKPMSAKEIEKRNDSIIRQVAFKGAIELASKGLINVGDIKEFTDEFNNILR